MPVERPLPESERTVDLTGRYGLIRTHAGMLLVNAAENIHRGYDVPRWAAFAVLQEALASMLCGSAAAVERKAECAVMVATAAELVRTDHHDLPATEAACADLDRALTAYLSGARVQ